MAERAASHGSPRGHPRPALSRAELEELTGYAITPKMVFAETPGGDLYHLDGGLWHCYPPYPFPPDGN